MWLCNDWARLSAGSRSMFLENLLDRKFFFPEPAVASEDFRGCWDCCCCCNSSCCSLRYSKSFNECPDRDLFIIPMGRLWPTLLAMEELEATSEKSSTSRSSGGCSDLVGDSSLAPFDCIQCCFSCCQISLPKSVLLLPLDKWGLFCVWARYFLISTTLKKVLKGLNEQI